MLTTVTLGTSLDANRIDDATLLEKRNSIYIITSLLFLLVKPALF